MLIPQVTFPRDNNQLYSFHLICIHLQEKIVSRLGGLVDMCHGVVQLERHNKTTEDEVILFQGWDVKRFGKFCLIVHMYTKIS